MKLPFKLPTVPTGEELKKTIINSQIWRSIFRGGEWKDTPRDRAQHILGNVWLHLQPSRVRKHGLKWTYTFGLGGLSFFSSKIRKKLMEMNVQTEPSQSITLDSPMPFVEQRRSVRYEFLSSALVEIKTWKGRRRVDGIIHEASEKGLRLELKEEHILSEGDSVSILWKVPPVMGYATAATKCSSAGTIIRTRTHAKQPNIYGIRFDQALDEQLAKSGSRYQNAIILAGITLLGADIIFLKIRNLSWFWYSPFFQGYSLVVSLYILSKVVFSLFYKEPKDNGFHPKVSVIIAAKNEEHHITETIQHCFNADYPKDHLEVLAVDDGSTDKTWDVLTTLQKNYPQLTIHRFPKNRGKRHAMAYGAERAEGDFLIYMDSDSFIESDGIYKIVQPFVDPTIGAVAGHCLVEVEKDNAISKMEAVRYYMSQRIMKAAESVFGAVTCCPGPFSAYRKEVVLKFLP